MSWEKTLPILVVRFQKGRVKIAKRKTEDIVRIGVGSVTLPEGVELVGAEKEMDWCVVDALTSPEGKEVFTRSGY
jgi:hypothetical protein